MPDDKFRPRWASPPGDTIRTALTERHLSLAALGESLRLSPARVQAILTGTEALSIDIAQRLTRLIGGSVAFWMNRDCQFRDDLARIEARHWSAQFPTKQAAAFGWIPPPDRTTEALDAWLEFFDVPDVDTWQHEYLSVIRTAKFRTAAPTTVDQPAVAAWLRQAEITASRIEANPWRPAAFRQVLSDARPLTRQKDPRSFVAQLTYLCARAGVAVAVVRPPRGCPVSGATRFLTSDKALIVLSARYLADDQFWFTFFHEAGHLLLHDPASIYVDQLDVGIPLPSSPDEGEADDFAGDVLLPPDSRARLLSGGDDVRALIGLAREIGVSPGILVGQLQHLGKVSFDSRLNHLKRRYRWNASILETA
jgi:HTH-type transcriptional regulator/antitoxin HigA